MSRYVSEPAVFSALATRHTRLFPRTCVTGRWRRSRQVRAVMIAWVPSANGRRNAGRLDRVISTGHRETGGERFGVIATLYQLVVLFPFQVHQDASRMAVVNDDECFLALMPDGPYYENSRDSGASADAVHRVQGIIQHLHTLHRCDRYPDIASMNGLEPLHRIE